MSLENMRQFLFQNSEIIFEKIKRIRLDGKIFGISFYVHDCESKLKVVIFIYISACSREATLQIAPFYHSRKHFNCRFS